MSVAGGGVDDEVGDASGWLIMATWELRISMVVAPPRAAITRSAVG
ncbi:MAG TPA: hypothetical protein VK942_21425 [Actinomycetes bacterium]|nr:hypothetical protein [Actinomycetes bacterium]